MPTDHQLEPWILIAGGFHERGGMDRANLELARTLSETGHPLHLVGHRIDESIANREGVEVVQVACPFGSVLLGERRLARAASSVMRRVKANHSAAIAVANGGNATEADVNWVHYVHHASKFEDRGAPLTLRLKNRIAERTFRRSEKRAIQAAKLIIANSELTRRHCVDFLRVSSERVKTVYLGSNADWSPASEGQRRAARDWLGVPMDVPAVAFVGAIGHDRRKGFDTLWKAWRLLAKEPAWRAHLMVAGGGRQVGHWKNEAERLKLRVHVLGFTDRVRDVFAASDLLVSPSLYEPFGLNVTEAIGCGVPAIASANSGVAELFPADLKGYLLSDPRDCNQLADMLQKWSCKVEATRQNFREFGARIRGRSWQTVAEEFIATVHAEFGHSYSGSEMLQFGGCSRSASAKLAANIQN